jgi:hypothetical protein
MVAPLWRRGRLWLLLGGLVLVGALAVSAFSPRPGLPLDPASPAKGGSRALARLLTAHGTAVVRTDAVGHIPGGSTVVVAYPDRYTGDQLNALRRQASRVVLVAPADRTVSSLDARFSVADQDSDPSTLGPGCAPGIPADVTSGATAAGAVKFPAGTRHYLGAPGCYDGRVAALDRLVLLGSAGLVRNDGLAAQGVAALAVNVISTNGATRRVSWLLPGPEAANEKPSVWSVFPESARRGAGWLLAVGVLLALWRGRRLGPVVTEPLPVVVRAAEIVEGHGRLYRRARARDRAAEALRDAARQRLAARLALPRTAAPAQLVAALPADLGTADRTDADGPAAGSVLLKEQTPADDAALLQLALDLDALERRVAAATGTAVQPPP